MKQNVTISLDGVEKIYPSRRGDPIVALKDISLEFEEATFVSVVGPSGCGKSTLLMVLAGLIEATSGTLSIKGEPISGPRDDVGLVFQKPVLLPWKTVMSNVLLPVRIKGGDMAAAEERTRGLLEMVGLAGTEEMYPFELSGGMQQRAALVRALSYDPDILLMDEPFGALDAMTREKLTVDLQRIWLDSKKTVVFVTHSISEAVFLGDRVVVMGTDPGRVLEVIDVSIDRPRSLAVTTSNRFGEMVSHIRHLLGIEEIDSAIE
jgi:NitT/TauT family transport system ATP-binding protein